MSEPDLAAIVSGASDAIISGDLDGTIRTWNKGAERLYGYSAEEIIGSSFLKLIRREDLPRSRVLHANVAEGGPPVPEIDTLAIRKDGTTIDVSLSVSPMTDERGELIGAIVIGRDISRRRALMSQRREAEERFYAAFENAPIGLAIISLDGRFVEANQSLCNFLGRTDEELCELTFQEVTHPEDLQRDLNLLDMLVAGDIPRYEMEKRYLRPDGTAVWGLLCVSLVRDEAGEPHHFISQIMDIDASKQQDLDLQRLTGKLRGLTAAVRSEGSGLDRELDMALERAGGSGRGTADMEVSGVAALVAALEARDLYTAEHSRSVVELAGGVARRLALDDATVATVQRVAALHDVGKVAVPDAILQKRGPLSPSEWELMRQHPAVGERIVASTRTLAHLAAPIRAEHERWDGKGYPDGLSGEEIPIASRITLACDAFHAMTSDRPYRAAMAPAEAEAELEANAGTQFDPTIVEALLAELSESNGKVDA
ncbi:MAG: PAS domain S-box protein [Solirubrobacterales bacterium]|nr:PAS domain S-box protein [Solirubrobacterales bacterium]MCB8971121.1 PAS domain S-box protein [Thermoleophilales bacterium]MCO5327880.1 PAS domain S-box protein [Solirubrobacterales bacterium]